MPADIPALVADLAAETAVLDALLAPLSAVDWALATPSVGWNITDQVTHLAYFDDMTITSLRDPDLFRVEAAVLVKDGEDFPDRVAAEFHSINPGVLLDWFRTSRADLLSAYVDVDPRARLPWYGPEMGVASSVTARLMETWAHGQDVSDALGVTRQPTSRLKHVAHLGVAGLPYSYAVNGLELPTRFIRIEVVAPSGELWTWGPRGAEDTVAGSALDFCLAVTQRRHLSDLDLVIKGSTATQWMSIAQTYAGAAGTGRAPLGETVGIDHDV